MPNQFINFGMLEHVLHRVLGFVSLKYVFFFSIIDFINFFEISKFNMYIEYVVVLILSKLRRSVSVCIILSSAITKVMNA